LLAVLDEISGFASEVGTGNEQGKTAENIYKAFRGSVDISFSRSWKGCFTFFSKISRRFYIRKI